MKFLASVALLGAALMSLPAAAINKCTGADGKVTFQDAPCSTTKSETINVRPASGQAISPRVTKPSDAGAPAAPLTEAARLEGIVAASQRSRRANDLRERLLPDAERAVKNHREACEARQKELAAQQYAYHRTSMAKRTLRRSLVKWPPRRPAATPRTGS